MKTFFVAGLAAVATLIAAPVAAKTYACKLTENGSTGIIPEVVLVDFTDNSDKVMVLDPIIKYYKGGPIEGKVSIRNNRRTTFTWTVTNVTAKGGGRTAFTSGLVYRLTVQKSSHSAMITVLPRGYDDKYSGSGQCELRS